ncbi:MAG: cobyrinate a,c-diamide synthase [Cyanobacteria bacterium RU_5_0]|nr:cobyrinate a,c-diamide synthase [Cyanobacteria bacterium RU_5_0]
MALVIAGERSGVGKTTITLLLLATLRRRCLPVQSFKVGPDYIDPMFHSYVTGRACRTLDPILTSHTYVQQCFSRHTQAVDYALVEGVMGLFDGVSGTEDLASTAQIARSLDLPILLVLDCSRLSRSIAAVAHGYQSFDSRLKLAGLILNRVGSDRHLTLLKSALEPLKLPILGVLNRHDEITIPDRHLGLVPTAELKEFDQIIDRLADLGETCFDWTLLLAMLKTKEMGGRGKGRQAISSPQIPHSTLKTPHSPIPSSPHPPIPSPIRLAIAHDRAFNFYYPDNLELLEQLGAELVVWSPLEEDKLPEGVHGLYFGGGFPEVFAERLSDNVAARRAVRSAVESGMPTYAECGGLMYLAKQLVDFEGRSWEMVGVIPTTAEMSKRLTLGYRRAIVLQDSPLLPANAIVWGHEFHRSVLTTLPESPLYQIRGYDPQSLTSVEGWQFHQIHASYVHLHWGARPEIPARFLESCRCFAQVQIQVQP